RPYSAGRRRSGPVRWRRVGVGDRARSGVGASGRSGGEQRGPGLPVRRTPALTVIRTGAGRSRYAAEMAARKEVLEVGDREVTVTNPGKVYFPETGHTKLDLVRYYVSTAEAVLRGVYGRPMALKRYVNGVAGEAFYQKRAPKNRPEWIETV